MLSVIDYLIAEDVADILGDFSPISDLWLALMSLFVHLFHNKIISDVIAIQTDQD